MEILVDIIKWFLMLSGLFFCIIGVLGFVRMPDIYTKQHSIGLIDTLGFVLIMLSLSIQSGFSLVSLKPIFLAIIVFCLSAPLCYAFLQYATRKKGDFTYINDKSSKDVGLWK